MSFARTCDLVLLLVVISTTIGLNTIMIEMEDIAMGSQYEGRLFMRSNASGEKTVLIYNSETIDIHLCPSQEETMLIERVAYSTDGYTDDVKITLDGNLIGEFMTHNGTNYGYLWNEFHHSGVVGMQFPLQSNMHNLSVSLVLADPYGVELDYIKFGFSISTTAAQVLCPVHEYARNKTLVKRDVRRQRRII